MKHDDPQSRKIKSSRLLLYAIVICALFFRLTGMNWDNNFDLHPDERMLMIVTTRITWDNLNTEFFNYGNFPIYLLKGIAQVSAWVSGPQFAQYKGIFAVGRATSATFDIGTLLLIYFIAKKIFGQKTGLLASFFYAISVFPIQNAHFFTVDTQLTFWITAIIALAVAQYKKPSFVTWVLFGLLTGIAAATKITGLITLVIPFMVLCYDSFYPLLEQKSKITLKKVKDPLRRFLGNAYTIASICVFTFFLSQPYVFINFTEFLRQIKLQLTMSHDATIFPYTLQFINTFPYLTQLEDIIRWGLGYPLGLLALGGTVWLLYKFKEELTFPKLLIVGFFLIYFFVLGRSAVKFMRYYLPLYPILAVTAASFAIYLVDMVRKRYESLGTFIAGFGIATILIWPIAFMQIYLQPHTRVAASNWMNTNLPAFSTIAVEHWDDALPLKNQNGFHIETLEVYQPETQLKWDTLNQQLASSDYLVISSKRVYRSIMNDPLQYPKMQTFYQQLFKNESEFKLYKTFTSYPKIDLGFTSIEFNDDAVQESFTSYDHPKVMIFKKE